MKNSKLILICLFMLMSASVFSQTGGIPGFGSDGEGGTGVDVPINGLLYIAMAVGGYLGARKVN